MSGSDIIQWRLQDSVALETLTRGLLKVRPKLEQLQPAQATDGTETNRTKSNKHSILPSIFEIVSPLTLSDVSQPSGITWKGRKGWLKEYVQIAIRRVQENGEKTEEAVG